jgi:hypothetical protein
LQLTAAVAAIRVHRIAVIAGFRARYLFVTARGGILAN